MGLRVIRKIALVAILSVAVVVPRSTAARQQTDIPKNGEGIFRLLQRNGITPSKSTVAEFRELNATRLINGRGLKKGVSYVLPSTSDVRRYPIFGPAFQDVSIRSDRLDGCVYYVIGGHGGGDPGATGRRGSRRLYEDEYAYDVALRLARRLIEEGAIVYLLTRDDEGIRNDEYFRNDRDERNLDGSPVGNDQKTRLRKRVNDINRLQHKHKGARLQRVIELHVDSYRRSRQVDVDFYYHSRRGRELANLLQRAFDRQYDRIRPNRGYRGKVLRRSRLYTLKYAGPVTTLIELGNINHPGDQLRIIQPDNRQFVADWLALGFIEDAKKERR